MLATVKLLLYLLFLLNVNIEKRLIFNEILKVIVLHSFRFESPLRYGLSDVQNLR